MSFHLKEHIVVESNYRFNKRKDTMDAKGNNDGFDVLLSVDALVPREFKNHDIKNYDIKNDDIIIKTNFSFGNNDTKMFLTLKTIANIEYDNIKFEELDKAYLEKECLPIILKDVRNMVKNITAAYGIKPLELPPFKTEIIN